LPVLPFVKMHGIGNDYVYLDAVGDPSLVERPDLPGLARAIADRHTGVGSDGLILVCLPTAAGLAEGAHVRMRMFNADGSEGVMCGNGVRCVAKFARDRLGYAESPLRVETGRGVLAITTTPGADGRVESATVDMGEPILRAAAMPIDAAELQRSMPLAGGSAEGLPADTMEWSPPTGGLWLGPRNAANIADTWPTFVSMGNPHAVIEMGLLKHGDDGSDAAAAAREKGPVIEKHAAFPQGINVHFVKWVNPGWLKVWTWERGSGLTQACGTGACAVVVALALQGKVDREVRVDLPGGTLKIRWDSATNHVFMTGPAADVCTGQWPLGSGAPLASIPTLTTERLVLRPLRHSDATAVAALAGDRRISDTTLTVPHPYELHHATGWISTHALGHNAGLSTVWGVFVRTPSGEGPLVGAIGIVYSRHNTAEVGYWMGVPFWNRGYTSEAAGAVLRYGFGQRTPPLQRIDAHHFLGNDASGKVMERIGMTREGTSHAAASKKGVALDVARYAITRQQWESSQ